MGGIAKDECVRVTLHGKALLLYVENNTGTLIHDTLPFDCMNHYACVLNNVIYRHKKVIGTSKDLLLG